MGERGRLSRRNLLRIGALAAIRFEVPALIGGASASVGVPQTPLPGASIPRFVTPLRTFTGRRVRAGSITVRMAEFQDKVLPDSVYLSLPGPFKNGTYLWGYAVGGTAPQWPGTTVETKRGFPATVRYVNDLPSNPVLGRYLTIDQTIHWANPYDSAMSPDPYCGPIPTVVHLHGGENKSTSDGAPEGWFTSTGRHGRGYSTIRPTAGNSAVYHYPNGQQATTLWFHDHALGITRTNVLAGLAAFYLVRDQYDTGRPDNPLRLPAGDHEIELLVQDRQFDTNGQLLWPDSAANPSLVDGPPPNPKIHPFWIPEFFGDVMCVNGRAWPYLAVEPRRYRFRFLNGSNARFVRMGLIDASSGAAGPAMWVIGTDGGLLDAPVKLTGKPEPAGGGTPAPTSRMFLSPAERMDVIIDFTGQAGKKFTLTNDAQVPFPSGNPLAPSDPTRNVLQFQVTLPLSGTDRTYNPATGAPLRGGARQEPKIVRLANPATGAVAPGVTVDKRRQLILFEFESPTGAGGNMAGMPVIDLVNNTKWTGHTDGGGDRPVPGGRPDRYGQGLIITELPRVGSTEIWEFLNLTEDVHPMHIHLVEFQLLNRQPTKSAPGGDFDDSTYMAAWAAAFKGGTFNGETADGSWGPVTYPKGTPIPGYGPPLPYDKPNADGALGGNPAFSPYLTGPVLPPNPEETGWKDTVKVYPSYVNRFIIRWAPQAIAVGAVKPGQNRYSFDPAEGPGYLVHCHIHDHEDNEMMRPYIPVR